MQRGRVSERNVAVYRVIKPFKFCYVSVSIAARPPRHASALKCSKMSTIQVYFEYYRYFLLGNKFSEQDAARGESLRGAGGRAGHYLCGEVDPAPAMTQ